jgi:hypothetical protein
MMRDETPSDVNSASVLATLAVVSFYPYTPRSCTRATRLSSRSIWNGNVIWGEPLCRVL